jgi:hypothetical protein
MVMVTISVPTGTSGSGAAGAADRQHVVVELRHRRGDAVEDLVLEEDHRIGIADRRLEQTLGIGRGRRRHDLEPGDM